ncbi:MAG: hypothetical protein HZB51_09760 [Chloroflexi bacterium]|nr:hypothetical protein [Chloroflexota bacterium]
MSQSPSFLSSLLDLLSRLFGGSPPSTPPETPPSTPPTEPETLTPMTPRALVIVFNPVVDSATGRKLIETMGWNDPDQLVAGYIADVDECSGGLVKYSVTQRIDLDEIPVKEDGFQYSPQQYLNVARTNTGAHDPDMVDYGAIIANNNLLQRAAAKEFDEVWLFGAPYFGFWESAMAGAGAFFSNGGPIANTASCPRKFIIMGFNYQRGVGEMLEDLGHRAESILSRVFHSEDFLGYTYDRERNTKALTTSPKNLFERFMYFDQIAPGKANLGSVHYAPNSPSDYEWGVTKPVLSCADDWDLFPNLPDPPNYRMMSARDWGNGDIRGHHKWWLAHLPKVADKTKGISNFWWKYFIDPNTVL